MQSFIHAVIGIGLGFLLLLVHPEYCHPLIRQLSIDIAAKMTLDELEAFHHEMDQATVTIVTPFEVALYSRSNGCHSCPLDRRMLVKSHCNQSLEFATQYSHKVVINKTEDNSLVCESHSVHFVDSGQYVLNISNQPAKENCVWTRLNSPPDSNLPVYIMLAVIVGVSLLWIAVKYLYRRGMFNRFLPCLQMDHLINNDLGSPLIADDGIPGFTGSMHRQSARIQAVDTFRGLSLVLMVFVNYGGGGYWYFQHSPWNGITVADLVFPWFVFLMGTSIAVSFRSAVRRGTSRLTLLWRVVRRTFVLFFIGLALSNHGHDVLLSHLRILGVLQRLALTYFVVATFEAFVAMPSDPHTDKWWRGVRELVVSWPTWLVAIVMVVIHTSLTFFLEVPGCGSGYIGPGGLDADRRFENCTGGAAGYIDRAILTGNHVYARPTCMRVYECSIPFDPEGILGTLTSVVLCILGLQAGKILITYQTPRGLLHRWIIWGLISGVLAGVLCEWKENGGPIPINKNLWSMSFVLATAAMAFLLLAVFYLIIDANSLWSGAPFLYPGMNSILIYVCHEVFHEYFPLHFHVPSTHAAQLAINVWGTLFWVAVAAVMHWKHIFVAI